MELIERQAVIDALCEEYCFGHHDCKHYPKCENLKVIQKLPSAQPSCDDATFWRKRANEYEDQCLKLIAEMTNGVKVDSIRIDKDGIFFAKKQPEPQWIPCSDCERRCEKWEHSKTLQE